MRNWGSSLKSFQLASRETECNADAVDMCSDLDWIVKSRKEFWVSKEKWETDTKMLCACDLLKFCVMRQDEHWEMKWKLKK